MEKYIGLGFLSIGLAIAGILWVLRILINTLRKLQRNLAILATSYEMGTYHFARFIVFQLQDKAKTKDLTEDEQDLFHRAREVIAKLDDHIKQATAQQS